MKTIWEYNLTVMSQIIAVATNNRLSVDKHWEQ